MFNGIVQSRGKVFKIHFGKDNFVDIKTKLDLHSTGIGSSLSCNGICLTIINKKKINKEYMVRLNFSEETINKSNIKYWKKNTLINLEKSMILNQEISGHFVYGHIDGVSIVKKINKLPNSWYFYFSYPNLNEKKFFVQKGSITINGISLTIAKILKNSFSVNIIPHTLEVTNFSDIFNKLISFPQNLS